VKEKPIKKEGAKRFLKIVNADPFQHLIIIMAAALNNNELTIFYFINNPICIIYAPAPIFLQISYEWSVYQCRKKVPVRCP